MGDGCLTVIGAMLAMILSVYVAEHSEAMFVLATLPFIVLTILALYGAVVPLTRYPDQLAVRKKMRYSKLEEKPKEAPKVEEVPEWKLEAERIKKQMLLDSYKERAEIIRRTEEKALLDQQRLAKE